MGFKQNLKQMWDYLWANHRGATLGVLIAFVLSVAILLFGFWSVVFIALCVGIGLFVGKLIDENADVRGFVQEFIGKFKKKN